MLVRPYGATDYSWRAIREVQMALFKKSLRGPDFADALVSKVSTDIYTQWSDIQSTISKSCESVDLEARIELSEAYAPLVVAASVVVDLQAAKNLRGEDMFNTLRDHVINRLDAAVGIDSARELLDAYQAVWDEAVDRGENPVSFGIASALYDFLKIPLSSGIQNTKLLIALGEAIMLPIGYTKFALEEYRVKP